MNHSPVDLNLFLRVLQNISFPSMVMLGSQTASAHSCLCVIGISIVLYRSSFLHP